MAAKRNAKSKPKSSLPMKLRNSITSTPKNVSSIKEKTTSNSDSKMQAKKCVQTKAYTRSSFDLKPIDGLSSKSNTKSVDKKNVALSTCKVSPSKTNNVGILHKKFICKSCKTDFPSNYFLKKHLLSCVTSICEKSTTNKSAKTVVDAASNKEERDLVSKASTAFESGKDVAKTSHKQAQKPFKPKLISKENRLTKTTQKSKSSKNCSNITEPSLNKRPAVEDSNTKLIKQKRTLQNTKSGEAKEINNVNSDNLDNDFEIIGSSDGIKNDNNILKSSMLEKISKSTRKDEEASFKIEVPNPNSESKVLETIGNNEGVSKEVLQSSMFNKVKSLLSNSNISNSATFTNENFSEQKNKTGFVQISTSNMRKNLAFSMEKNCPIARKSLPVLITKNNNKSDSFNESNSDSEEITVNLDIQPSCEDAEIVSDVDVSINGATLANIVKKEKEISEHTENPSEKENISMSETYNIGHELITIVEPQNSGIVTAVKNAHNNEPTILPDGVEPEILTPLQPVKDENDKQVYEYVYEPSDIMVYSEDPGPSSYPNTAYNSDSVSSEKTNSKGSSYAFTCAVCQKHFSRKYHLDRHLKISRCSGLPMPTFPCELCNRVYTRKDNLREHLRSHTGEVHRRKNHKCTYCDKAFHGQSLLAIHMRKHTGEKPFACDFCPKRFPSSGALTKHRMTHTGEKPYGCQECGRRFTLKGTLSRHQRTHTGVRPHACKYCGKQFIQIGGLNAHMFFHTGENGFKCEECGKIFNRKARLQMHQLYVHIKLKPFVCDYCQKPFTRKEDLMRHTVLHTGEKPYKCPTCDRGFSVKPSLKLHLLTHTKEEPRSCHECGRAFIRKDCLLRHMRKRHRDVFDKLLFDDEKDEKTSNIIVNKVLSESDLTESIRELLNLLIDEPTLVGFGWPDTPVDEVLELVIQRCGHTPVSRNDYQYMDRLRENAKLLFTVVIDDNAVKTLLNNQTVDEVILHVLRLAKT